VAQLINERKENFYKEYYYLKPENEKSGWEKFKDGFKSAAEWCKENWKSIVKIVAAAVIITGLGIAASIDRRDIGSCTGRSILGSIGRWIDRRSGRRNSCGDKWWFIFRRILRTGH